VLNKAKKKLGGKFRRYSLTVNPKIYRPSSSPFISGDTLRSESKFIFDETQTFNPLLVKTNDIVFLKTDLKEIYFKIQHPKINNKYILISHNSDMQISHTEKNLIDEKIIHWFGQNLSFKCDEKFSAIPIGFENRRYLHNGRLKNLKKIEGFKTNKNNKILSSYSSTTNPQTRNNLNEIINELKFINNVRFENYFEYLINLKKHSFILCPEGNGLDTHRIWEALLTKTVPILLKSDFSLNFYNLGMPIHIVNNWSDLEEIDESKINMMYEDFINFEYSKFIKKEFWMNLINEKKINQI
tara:strand:- start:3639 stop:4532 length:894 start_codon:yes stop_codon:yes gene_type:complete